MALLSAAEKASFELFVTTDQNLRYQQNMEKRRIAILVLPTTRWSQISAHGSEIVSVINTVVAGEYREVRW